MEKHKVCLLSSTALQAEVYDSNIWLPQLIEEAFLHISLPDIIISTQSNDYF